LTATNRTPIRPWSSRSPWPRKLIQPWAKYPTITPTIHAMAIATNGEVKRDSARP